MGAYTDRLQEDVLERMLEVAQHLSASTGITEVLTVIINAMRDVLGADRATVFEYDPQRGELFSTVAHGLDSGGSGIGEIRIPADAGFAGHVAQRRRILNVPDAYADERFNRDVDRKTGYRTRSILTVPLLDPDGELIGVAQVLNKHDGPFDNRDERIAEAMGSLAAVAIKRSRLIEHQIVREKLERDLQLARNIQQRTFPKQLPQLAGYELDAWSEPAEETGGDAYDVIGYNTDRSADGSNRALLMLADATGHGIGPAIAVAQVRAMLRMAARLHLPRIEQRSEGIARIIHHLNQQLCQDLPADRFITAWLGELNTTEHVLETVSGGQAPLLYYAAGRRDFETMGADAIPLGISTDWQPPDVRTLSLQPGDIFAVISDGVFEAQNAAGEQFGGDRVRELIASNCDKTPIEISRALRDATAVFTEGRPPDDDRTAVIIKRNR